MRVAQVHSISWCPKAVLGSTAPESERPSIQPFKARRGLCNPACQYQLWPRGGSLDPARRGGPFARKTASRYDCTGRALRHMQTGICSNRSHAAGYSLHVLSSGEGSSSLESEHFSQASRVGDARQVQGEKGTLLAFHTGGNTELSPFRQTITSWAAQDGQTPTLSTGLETRSLR